MLTKHTSAIKTWQTICHRYEEVGKTSHLCSLTCSFFASLIHFLACFLFRKFKSKKLVQMVVENLARSTILRSKGGRLKCQEGSVRERQYGHLRRGRGGEGLHRPDMGGRRGTGGLRRIGRG